MIGSDYESVVNSMFGLLIPVGLAQGQEPTQEFEGVAAGVYCAVRVGSSSSSE